MKQSLRSVRELLQAYEKVFETDIILTKAWEDFNEIRAETKKLKRDADRYKELVAERSDDAESLKDLMEETFDRISDAVADQEEEFEEFKRLQESQELAEKRHYDTIRALDGEIRERVALFENAGKMLVDIQQKTKEAEEYLEKVQQNIEKKLQELNDG